MGRRAVTETEFADAAVRHDFARTKELLDAIPPDAPLYGPARAIWLYFEVRENRRTMDELQEAVRVALETPPEDLELFLLALTVAAKSAILANQIDEAQRIIGQTKELSRHNVRVDFVFRIRAVELAIAEVLDRSREQLQAIDKALALCVGRALPDWFVWKARRIRWAVKNEDFEMAERHIAEYETRKRGATAETNRWLAWLKAFLCCLTGEIEEGLRIWDGAPWTDPGEVRFHFCWKPRVQLLAKAGRTQEAEALIDRIENHFHGALLEGEILPPEFDNYRARIALAKRDLDGMRRYILKILSGDTAPFRVEHDKLLLLLVQHALGTGNPRAARVVLRRLDPDETAYRYAAEWARLYLLEGNERRAASHFAKILEKNRPRLAEDKVRWAYELAPHQVGRLFMLSAKAAREGAEAVAPVEIHTPPADPDAVVFVGRSAAADDVLASVEKYAAVRTSVLITGETGTGKEVVARLLHRRSPWAAEPFIPVNCAAFSETLIESELFGHVKGAFTGAVKAHDGLFVAAGQGTLLLDEIHTMPTRLQAMLLRVLENGEVRPAGGTKIRRVQARVIATTNESLEEAVKSKAFRKDLYYRLARLHIHIPPLREREEDVPLLARYFLRGFFEAFDVVLGEDLVAALQAYAWPGNVRQLRNEIERIALVAGESRILGAGLFRPVATDPDAAHTAGAAEDGGPDPTPPQRPPEPAGRLRTFERRQRLRELFEQRPRLTRAEVVERLHCAPDTATRDLKALERDGLIRRVETSAHLRTSYFEKC
ncbi:MAG: sigma-54-dependent Fis family transcriptional regulator [Kiritimatiellae bacterium]|nr:sigma-54-dependent Fis family transcriptional regulator [Kiritimatiellia bacterium]